jgi:PhnB protein
MSFNPYLMFVGNCREAMTRYQEVLGGDLQIMDLTGVPEEERPPGAPEDMVMHAALTLGTGFLMASDDPTATERSPILGIFVAYSSPTVEDTNRIVAALGEGGSIDQEVIETFFSPAFGIVTDRFGVPWMISTEPDQAA